MRGIIRLRSALNKARMPLERARRDSHIVEVTGSQINDRSELLSTHPLQQIQASQTRRFRPSA